MNDAMAPRGHANGFVAGGAQAYVGALRKQYRVEMDQLTDRLKAAETDPEREQLRQQMARLAEEYRRKSRAIDRSLF